MRNSSRPGINDRKLVELRSVTNNRKMEKMENPLNFIKEKGKKQKRRE